MSKYSAAVLAALPLAAAEYEDAQRRAEQAKREQEQIAKQQQVRSQMTWRIYKDDPVAWVHDMIDWRDGEGPASYQNEIMAELPRRKRVAVRGPHTMGKSAMLSWIILWYAITRDGEDWKIPTTASAWRQLTKFLWPEIRKWARRIKWDKVGRDPFDRRTELLMNSLKLATGEAFAMASDQPENMEGAHADHLLGILDESKTIPDQTFDALEGAFSGTGETLAIAASTPGEPNGRFYDIHSRKAGTEDWWVRHVTMDEAIAAGRMDREWAEQRAKQWGTQSAVYQNRVLGEFAASDEDGVIPLAWIELANERWRAIMDVESDEVMLPPFTAVGTDVGSGSVKADKTVHALRFGDVLYELRRYQHEDTMQTAGRVKGILDANGGRAIVDSVGIGLGVLNRLHELHATAIGFVAGASSKKLDRSGELGFSNKRSEAWYGLRERLDPGYGEQIALPPDDTLIGDLTAPKYRVLSGGKIQIESKEELRKPERLGRSTDDGDAVVQAFWEPDMGDEIVGPVGMGRETPGWNRDG